ncbi:MAG: YceH family protein [Acidobacteriota bacterium]
MELRLNEYEVRVIGALIEKQITTPDYYPMTLNALVNACNQKNNRHPVVSYDEETVSRALGSLREKKLAFIFHGAEARVAKFGHVFPKAYDLSQEDVAILCVLMLRGPQTLGELRSRAQSLYNFESLAEVESTVEALLARDDVLMVARLPRLSGMKEPRYAHLLSGEVEFEASEPVARTSSSGFSARADTDRVAALEETVSRLRRDIDELKEELAQFRRQFE